MKHKKYPKEYSRRGPLRVLYNKWAAMRARCGGKDPQYKNRYFDRGITICEEWSDWPTFAKWALENGFSEELTLDRTNNDEGYFPENCRFVTTKENSQNRDRDNLVKSFRKSKTKIHARPFVCCETNQIFLTRKGASRKIGIDDTAIGRVLNGMYRQMRGYTFKYIMIPLAMYDELLEKEIQSEGISLSS